MANSCEDWQFRCEGCPMNYLAEETGEQAGRLADETARFTGYTHLFGASIVEIIATSERATVNAGDRALKGVVAGALGLVASGRCNRN